MSYLKPVRQLRACFFAHTLADVVGCAATGPAFSRWGDAWWAKHTGRRPPDMSNHKWPAYLAGSLPRATVCAPLVEAFPLLQNVLDDPLWPILQRLVHPLEDTSCWASQLRLNGSSFRYHSPTRLLRLCGIPDWHRLAGVLALLSSEHSFHSASQEWLRREFTGYVLCLCRDLPGRLNPLMIYRVLEEGRQQGKLGVVLDWPKSDVAFQLKLHRLDRIQRRLQERGWILGWRPPERLMFWRLLRERKLLARLLTSHADAGVPQDALYSRVKCWVCQIKRDQVSFEGADPKAWAWCDRSRGGSPPFAWVVPSMYTQPLKGEVQE